MRRLLLGLLLASLPVVAQVYTYVDADGNRVFTDKPRMGNAERVQLAPSNQMPAPAEPPVSIAPTAPPAVPTGYEMLRILVPEPDATLNNGTGDLIVTATSDPTLREGHGYRLLLDGQATGQAGRSPVFTLQNLDRGTHQLAVEIVDAQGRTLERTPNQPLHVRRISLAQKRMVKPCQKDDYGVRPECPLKDKPEEEGHFGILPFF